MGNPALTCRDVVTVFTAYLNEEGEGRTRAGCERHLSKCGACVRYLRTYRVTTALAKAAFVESDDACPCIIPDKLVHTIVGARATRFG